MFFRNIHPEIKNYHCNKKFLSFEGFSDKIVLET